MLDCGNLKLYMAKYKHIKCPWALKWIIVNLASQKIFKATKGSIWERKGLRVLETLENQILGMGKGFWSSQLTEALAILVSGSQLYQS